MNPPSRRQRRHQVHAAHRVLPDVIANAGGVTVSYYEWVQNRRSEQWTLEAVETRLEGAMRDAYQRMIDFDRDYRLACYGVALQRLGERDFPCSADQHAADAKTRSLR